MNFSSGAQPLVDVAFLAQAMLRAPNELWHKLDPHVQVNTIDALKASRSIQAYENNWKLFATTIEVSARLSQCRARTCGKLAGNRGMAGDIAGAAVAALSSSPLECAPVASCYLTKGETGLRAEGRSRHALFPFLHGEADARSGHAAVG
jgi:hypothetical protein